MQYTVQKFVMSTCAHISRLSLDVPPIAHAEPAELTFSVKRRDTVGGHDDHVCSVAGAET